MSVTIKKFLNSTIFIFCDFRIFFRHASYVTPEINKDNTQVGPCTNMEMKSGRLGASNRKVALDRRPVAASGT